MRRQNARTSFGARSPLPRWSRRVGLRWRPPGCGAHLLGTRRANVHHGVREESEEGEEGEGIQVREEGQEGAVVFRGRDEETAAAADAPGKAKRKANLIEWFRRCLRDDTEGARAAFVKARDYVAVANVIRAHARKPSVAGAHDEAVKLLDNKGNFLHIVQTCVDGHPEATASWDKVVKHHRAKFEKAGGADAIAEKKRAAREAKEQYKLLQKERAEREAKLKELAKLRQGVPRANGRVQTQGRVSGLVQPGQV